MQREKGERCLIIIYFALYLATAFTLAFCQPHQDTYPLLTNPPDEHSRYMVPLYICNHGTLPTGFEEELMSGDCKWTYGFYTLLPYMAQGYAMRFVDLFTDSPLILLYTARMVNVLSGLAMAGIVILISRKLFEKAQARWIFCFLVMFLPQSLFLHTYVNPDSFCLLSTSLMVYGLLRGYGDGFQRKSCLILAAGVIICALSYYNAYGFILSSILLFAAFFFRRKNGRWQFEWSDFLKKGLGISALVLLCISWSFIRNYVLYDGDVIGLDTMQNMIKANGVARDTLKSCGKPLSALFTEHDFLYVLRRSFIASYGSMSIWGPPILYQCYGVLLGGGLLLAVILKPAAPVAAFGGEKTKRVFFHANMVLCIVMPFAILVRYAYSVDYQAQGRYILPGLIPLMFYVARGVEKLLGLLPIPDKGRDILAGLLMAAIAGCLIYMVFRLSLPLYRESGVM